MNFRLALSALVLCLLAAPLAAQQQSPDIGNVPPLQAFRDAGAEVVPLGRRQGMDGWLVYDKRGEIKTVYATPDGGGLVLGLLFDADGKALTHAQLLEAFDNGLIDRTVLEAAGNWTTLGQAKLAQAVASDGGAAGPSRPELSPGDQLLAELEKVSWFSLGQAEAPVFYSFVDPACPHCKKMWSLIAPAVSSGRLQPRLVPIYNRPENRDLASALLAAPNAALAWQKLALGGDDGGLGSQAGTPATLSAVDANLALHQRWKLGGTPYSVYRNKAGKVRVIIGVPGDLEQLLTDIGG